MTDEVLWALGPAGVTTLTLNRTQARNALNTAMAEALLAAAQRAVAENVRLVLVRAHGPVFCAGADLKERKGMTEDQVRARRLKGFAAYDALERLPMPSIAVVEGPAIGSGCEIAAACDFIIATPDASFRTPEALWGTIGATQRLPRIIGKRLAKDMMFTGRTLSAEEAHAAGLVARIVPPERLIIAESGLSTPEDLAELRARTAFAHARAPEVPVLDEEQARAALLRACEGRRSFGELRRVDLHAHLLESLPPEALARLHRLAPTHATLPGGRRLKIHYEIDRPPWVESWLQDFFGMATGPQVGDTPLVVHLLAPNRRAVQVTTDLAGFWTRHYPALRRQLMRRYPRHEWPEDPATARPPPPSRSGRRPRAG